MMSAGAHDVQQTELFAVRRIPHAGAGDGRAPAVVRFACQQVAGGLLERRGVVQQVSPELEVAGIRQQVEGAHALREQRALEVAGPCFRLRRAGTVAGALVPDPFHVGARESVPLEVAGVVVLIGRRALVLIGRRALVAGGRRVLDSGGRRVLRPGGRLALVLIAHRASLSFRWISYAVTGRRASRMMARSAGSGSSVGFSAVSSARDRRMAARLPATS